jgi:hypothetical protein
MKHITIILASGVFLLVCGCSDWLEVEAPKTQITSANVFTSDGSATSAISGIYASMMNSSAFASGGSGSMMLLGGLSSDELIDLANSPVSRQFYRNSLEATNSSVDNAWVNLYQYIYYSNSILEGLQSAAGMTDLAKKQIEGEARFVRAFSYFYLVSLYGDVPLVTTTNYKESSVEPRMPAADVYAHITSDLQLARDLMLIDYSHASGNRIRPNSFAASAMLARVYLFNQKWNEAEVEASRVINNTTLYGMVTDLNSVFLRTSREAIWQLMPTAPQFNTYEATIFRNLATAALTSDASNDFESGDRRKTNWLTPRTQNGVTYNSPFKYKVGVTGQPLTEFSMVIRLAEMYLIRSEARAKQGNLNGAATDLNVIRQRAGLSATTAITETDLISAILIERRHELFAEWGHRWMDLKRSGLATNILQPKKAEWQSTDVLYPIPKAERDTNAKITQNPGY